MDTNALPGGGGSGGSGSAIEDYPALHIAVHSEPASDTAAAPMLHRPIATLASAEAERAARAAKGRAVAQRVRDAERDRQARARHDAEREARAKAEREAEAKEREQAARWEREREVRRAAAEREAARAAEREEERIATEAAVAAKVSECCGPWRRGND